MNANRMLQKSPDIAQVLAREEQRSRLRRRTVWLVILGIVVAAVALAAWWYLGAPARNGQHYLSEPATLGDISVKVVATGTLEPTGKAAVSATIPGTIASVSAKANDRVSKGQVLAQLDMGDLDAQLSRATGSVNSQKANVRVAETNLADAEAALGRAQALSSGQTVSVRELELAASAVKRAQAQQALSEAQLVAALADLQGVRNDYDKACICAPIDGVVLEANVDPGQAIATAGLGQTLFSLAEDLRRLDLEVDIDEADIGSVSEGDTASFVVEAWPQRTFAGVIREIRYAPTIVDGVVSYAAMLDVDNSDMLLRPGMTSTAEITVDEAHGVLTVPNAALRFSPRANSGTNPLQGMMPSSSIVVRKGNERSVWKLDGGNLTEVKVTVGLDDGLRSQITGGPLRQGDLVVVGTAAD